MSQSFFTQSRSDATLLQDPFRYLKLHSDRLLILFKSLPSGLFYHNHAVFLQNQKMCHFLDMFSAENFPSSQPNINSAA